MDIYLILLHVRFVLILMTQTLEAIVLPKAIRLQLIQNTSKQWNKYNLKAMETLLSDEFKNSYSTLPLFLERGLKKYQAVIKVSKTRYIGSNLPTNVDVTKPVGEFQKSMEVNTKPLGPHEKQVQYKLHPGYPLCFSYTSIWRFLLDPRLELNLTFHRTYFSSYLSSKCVFGNLTLLTYFHTNTSNFVYCGQYATTSNYPGSRAIDIILAIERFVAFDIVVSYSVIEFGIFESISLSLSNNGIQPLSLIQMFPTDYIFYQFHLSTEKFKRIYLCHDSKQIQKYLSVYDGPDNHTAPLEKISSTKNLSWFLTQTFQCVVQLFFKEQDYFLAFKFKYFSEPIRNISKVTLNRSQIKFLDFSNANCLPNSQVWAVQVKVHTGRMVNVTIQDLTYNGQVHSMCNYGGLATYDIVNNSYIEISTICKQHTGVFKNRKIYSKTSLLLLVFYHYKEHANIKINLIVSATTCKSAFVNTFLLYNYCIWISTFLCNTFLKKIMEESDMLLQRSTLKIILKTKEGVCATLQLHYNRDRYQPITNYFRGYMDMQLQIPYREQTRREVFTSVTGFLKGRSILTNYSRISVLLLELNRFQNPKKCAYKITQAAIIYKFLIEKI